MGGVDALVAEDPAQLVDPFDAADHGPLEEQLQRDPQRHVDVEGVEVGAERAGVGAAVHQLQHRGLDLDVAVGVQGLPEAAGDGRAGPDHVPGLLAHGQVGVALPDPGLLGQLGVEVGHRPQRLGRQLPLAGQHRQLAALGGDHPAADEDEVAQVDVGLPGRQLLLADLGQGEHHLQPDAGVLQRQALLQRGEAELAGVADEHHPAGDADDVVGLLAGLQVAPLLPDLLQRVGARHADRIGLPALGQQPGPLLLANPQLLGQVGSGVSSSGTGSAYGLGAWDRATGSAMREQTK